MLWTYSWRNLWTRRTTTLLTAGGMGLVVYVFATVLMLSAGLKMTLVSTGSPDNALIIRQGADTEIQSSLDRNQTAILESLPQVALDNQGQRLFSRESLVLMVLPKRDNGSPSNVSLRGLSYSGLALRPDIHLAQGRWFRPGSNELVTGQKIAARFKGAALGETLHFAQRDWQIVGVLDAGNTGFASEVWGDLDQLMQSFRRNSFSTVLFRMTPETSIASVRSRLALDPRLNLQVQRETDFYASQSEALATFLEVLGLSLSVIFSIAAMVGALITMYGSVAARTREIGTLRALGFQREMILQAFMAESLLMGLAGGGLGLLLASGMQYLTISTMNWQTFSELSFSFTLTPGIVVKSMLFALVMGVIGGVLPARRAARLEILAALKE